MPPRQKKRKEKKEVFRGAECTKNVREENRPKRACVKSGSDQWFRDRMQSVGAQPRLCCLLNGLICCE